MNPSTIAAAIGTLALALAACTPAEQSSPSAPPTPDAIASEAPEPTAPAPSPPIAPAPSSRIPAPFLGEWNATQADCGTARNDSVLTLQPDRIEYWESSGPITAVTMRGAGEIELTATLTGEGETWPATARFKLTGEDTLVAIDATGGEMLRYRCPARD